MGKPVATQVGPFSEWDETMAEASDPRRYVEAGDKAAPRDGYGPGIEGIATRGDLTARFKGEDLLKDENLPAPVN